MFTSNQIEEIRKKLQLEGVKDSALPEAHPLTGKESIAVVQSGQNRKVGLDAFITSINNWCKADFLNLSKEGHSYTVEEAIAKTSPAKLGQVITFSNKKTGSWSIYQYTGETLEGWNDIDNWANILDTADYHFRGYFFNEELLKKNYPRPQVGDFAFIGTTLEEAVTFTCISAGNWYNTNYPALTFADKFKAVYSEDFGVFDAELEETLADRANKDAVGNVIHTYYASNKSLQETVSKEAVRAKEAEETNAKAISDETKARVSADTTLQGNIDKEATRAKQVEQANADAIKAVKETADSTKSITDAYFTEKKEFYDVIREEDVVLRTRDYKVDATTLEWVKLDTPAARDTIIIKLRNAKKIIGNTYVGNMYVCKEYTDETPSQIKKIDSPQTAFNVEDYNYCILSGYSSWNANIGDSIYGQPADWDYGVYPIIEMTQAEYDSQASKDNASIVPYLMQYMITGERVYPNYVTLQNKNGSRDWSIRWGAIGTLVRNLYLINNISFGVACNPRLETLQIENHVGGAVGSNKNLKKVWIKNITATDLGAFLTFCPALKEIVFEDTDFSSVTKFTDNSTNAVPWLRGNNVLTTITGKVSNIKVNISFVAAPLTRDSALVTINGLADLTGSDTQTVTFSSKTKALLTEEDKNLITSKNWTLA